MKRKKREIMTGASGEGATSGPRPRPRRRRAHRRRRCPDRGHLSVAGAARAVGNTVGGGRASSPGREPLLLDLQVVSITLPIRHRLLTVVFLGVVTSGLSLVALVRMLSTATNQRIERGRDNVSEEATRLAQEGAGLGADRQALLMQS